MSHSRLVIATWLVPLLGCYHLDFSEPDGGQKIEETAPARSDDAADSSISVGAEVITYPATGAYGINFLDPGVSTYDVDQKFSFAVNLPGGTSLKVRLTTTGYTIWGWDAFKISDCWNNTKTDFTSTLCVGELTVASSSGAQTCDQLLRINFMVADPHLLPFDGTCIKVEYYENFELFGATSPTKTKTVCLGGASGQPDAGRDADSSAITSDALLDKL